MEIEPDKNECIVLLNNVGSTVKYQTFLINCHNFSMRQLLCKKLTLFRRLGSLNKFFFFTNATFG